MSNLLKSNKLRKNVQRQLRQHERLVRRKWRVVHASDESGVPLNLLKPDNEQMARYIFENNEYFEVHPPFGLEQGIIIVCENKPRDLPIWGISFEPFSA